MADALRRMDSLLRTRVVGSFPQPQFTAGCFIRIGLPDAGSGQFKDIATGAYSWVLQRCVNYNRFVDAEPDADTGNSLSVGYDQIDLAAYEQNGIVTVWRNSIVWARPSGVDGQLLFRDPHAGWFIGKITGRGTGGGPHGLDNRKYAFTEQEPIKDGLMQDMPGGLTGAVTGTDPNTLFDLNSYSGNINGGQKPYMAWIRPGYFTLDTDRESETAGKRKDREYLMSVEAPWINDGEEDLLNIISACT